MLLSLSLCSIVHESICVSLCLSVCLCVGVPWRKREWHTNVFQFQVLVVVAIDRRNGARMQIHPQQDCLLDDATACLDRQRSHCE